MQRQPAGRGPVGVDAGWHGYTSTIKPIGTDQLEIRGCVMGFLCGGETWTRVGPPIPSSPVNSMAKAKAIAALPKTAAPKTTAPVAAAPKTTGSVASGAKPPAQKLAT